MASNRTQNRRDQAAYRSRLREKGQTQVLLTVPERYAVPLRRLASEMRDKDPADVDLIDPNQAGRAAAAEARVATLATGRSRDRQRAWKALSGRQNERKRALSAERLVGQLQDELHEARQTITDRDRSIGRIEGERDRARAERDKLRKERDKLAAQMPSEGHRKAGKALMGSGWKAALARAILGF